MLVSLVRLRHIHTSTQQVRMNEKKTTTPADRKWEPGHAFACIKPSCHHVCFFIPFSLNLTDLCACASVVYACTVNYYCLCVHNFPTMPTVPKARTHNFLCVQHAALKGSLMFGFVLNQSLKHTIYILTSKSTKFDVDKPVAKNQSLIQCFNFSVFASILSFIFCLFVGFSLHSQFYVHDCVHVMRFYAL